MRALLFGILAILSTSSIYAQESFKDLLLNPKTQKNVKTILSGPNGPIFL